MEARHTKAALCVLTVILCTYTVSAIKCYQCSSDQEKDKDKDVCGAFKGFNASAHALVDCLGPEAKTPGIFCEKVVYESPGTWGVWRTVHRRCASRSNYGVSWGCYWWYDTNGVYTEVCYCNGDGCNAGTHIIASVVLLLSLGLLSTVWGLWR